jgi:hypothetical protein
VRERRYTAADGEDPHPNGGIAWWRMGSQYDEESIVDWRLCRRTELVNPVLVRQWFNVCRREHKCQHLASEFPLKPTKFRLIDCKDMCLVVRSIKERYFALSYVWGAVESFETTLADLPGLQRPGCLKSKLDQLSKTVEDAIEFVQNLGQQYLWVDKLCIVQDEPAEKKKAIDNMALIYMRAHAVIIAASGCDANAGLPGVGENLRVNANDSQAPLSQLELNLLGESLAKSVYETRGWT